jgi:hypothetical protein
MKDACFAFKAICSRTESIFWNTDGLDEIVRRVQEPMPPAQYEKLKKRQAM